jgi:hypothetical protein
MLLPGLHRWQQSLPLWWQSLLRKGRHRFPRSLWKAQWLSALILCQDDITKKVLLRPITQKLSDTKSIQLELNLLLYEPLKEFATMTLLVILNIPLIRILNKEWYEILIGTGPGKFIIALSFGFIFIGLFALIKNLKPIDISETY